MAFRIAREGMDKLSRQADLLLQGCERRALHWSLNDIGRWGCRGGASCRRRTPSDDDLVTVRTYRFAHFADVDRMHLQAEDIPAFIADENVVTWDWILGQAIGFIKLQVPSSYADAAERILALHSNDQTIAENAPEPAEALRCLSCGERMLKDETTCPACGWSYSVTAEEAPAGEA